RPLREADTVEMGLRVFAGRVSAELERQRADNERRRVEDALRQSEQFHRLVAEIASDYAYSCVVHADGVAEMDAVTDGFVRVTGYEFEELQKLGGWPILIHPDDMHLSSDTVTPRMLRGEPGETELRIVTKQQEIRWIRFSMYPIWDEAQN